MSRTHQYTLSDGTPGSNCAPAAYVYKNANAGATERDWAANAIEDAFHQLWTDDRIEGYKVEVYNNSWFFLCDQGSLLDQFDTYRENNSYTEDGCHIAVHNCDSGPGAARGSGAWTGDVSAHVSINNRAGGTRSEGKIKATSIHEVSHTYIYDKYGDVDYLSGCSNGEHALGDVINNKTTPMAGGTSAIEDGVCNTQNPSWNGETTELTFCTRKAYEISADKTVGDCDGQDPNVAGSC